MGLERLLGLRALLSLPEGRLSSQHPRCCSHLSVPVTSGTAGDSDRRTGEGDWFLISVGQGTMKDPTSRE